MNGGSITRVLPFVKVFMSLVQRAEAERWSSRFFGFAALLAFFRFIWVICQTSGVFADTAPQWTINFETTLGIVSYAYFLAGLVWMGTVVYIRLQSDTNEPLYQLVINVLGGGLLILLVAFVANNVIDNPLPFRTWMGLLQTGIVRGGVFALIALGYTLVYGILFMINFAHGEVMMFGAYSGWLALMLLVDGGTRSFESGSALLAVWVVPILVGILFLPLEDLFDRVSSRKRPTSNVTDPKQIFTYLSIPVRLLLGGAVGYGALVGLGNAAPHIYLVVIAIVGLLFIAVIGMIASSLLAILLERIAYRPLRKAPRLTPLISAIGASIFLQQAALRIFGPIGRTYRDGDGNLVPKVLNDPVTFDLDLGRLGVVPISKVGIMITLVSLGLMALLYYIVQRTKFGRGMRAVAEDKDTAALMGANVDRIIVLTFVLGAALAGAAGVMLGFRGEQIRPRFGFQPGLKAFTAAVLGGIGNIPGAMLGGFFLGMVEALGPTALGIDNAWQNAISFALLVLVIIFRPTGILGEVVSEKKV